MADAAGRSRDADAAAEGAAGAEDFPIRCQGLEKSWELRVRPATRVHELKAQLAAASGIAVAQQRLIYQGRVLADGDALAALGVVSGHTVHVAVRPAGLPPRDAAAASATPASAAAMEAGGVRDEDLMALQLALEHELRLLAAQSAGPRGGGGEARRGVFGGSREGDTSDFFMGVAVGMLLGFVAFMCLLEPSAPRKLKAGLFLGVCLNITGSFSRIGAGSSDSREAASDW